MGLSVWHILIVLVVVLVIFGAGRLPNVMGDLGKGIRSFKEGLNADHKMTDSKDSADKHLPPPDQPS
jgi:sec-independent protein translocase protein TatA